MYRTVLIACCFLGLNTLPLSAQTQTINFSDLSLPANSYFNGSNGAGQFVSGGATFNNSYSATYGAWSGWSYSNTTDVTTPGYTNQYSAYSLPNGGGHNSSIYGVAYAFNPGDATIALPAGTHPLSIDVTNTTYAALAIKNGSSFSTAFTTGSYFTLNITGLDSKGNQTGNTSFYLANYLSSNPSQQYIVSNWTTVDLSSFAPSTTELSFGLTSSDVGTFGINTPTYFAEDNLVVTPATPEPTFIGLVATGGLMAWRLVRRRGRSLAKLFPI